MIYIPLCFYFIHVDPEKRKWELPIYIPLCFYFIWIRMEHWSTVSWIYIPLCFYFIRGRAPGDQHSSEIYIPLCFYFIISACRRIRHRKTFTFHYASTLSPTVGYFAQDSNVFTFHYASTLSDIRKPSGFDGSFYIPLCFYFIYTDDVCQGRRKPFYIPLCFYFITRWYGSRGGVKSFTFHYASTLSKQEKHGI